MLTLNCVNPVNPVDPRCLKPPTSDYYACSLQLQDRSRLYNISRF
jgi:hypothetical protein